jgi:hypothetical protein
LKIVLQFCGFAVLQFAGRALYFTGIARRAYGIVKGNEVLQSFIQGKFRGFLSGVYWVK